MLALRKLAYLKCVLESVGWFCVLSLFYQTLKTKQAVRRMLQTCLTFMTAKADLRKFLFSFNKIIFSMLIDHSPVKLTEYYFLDSKVWVKHCAVAQSINAKDRQQLNLIFEGAIFYLSVFYIFNFVLNLFIVELPTHLPVCFKIWIPSVAHVLLLCRWRSSGGGQEGQIKEEVL